MDTFEEYLLKKKIDSETFCKAEPSLWEEWKRLFEQMHPDSFTAQKLFLINPLRRKFPAHEEESAAPAPKIKKPSLPRMPPRKG